jgi:outer membrane receptor protein involved in Fe transport
MDDVGANITGKLIEGWAGPIKIAAGAEYRHLTLRETSSVDDNTFDATDLRVGANGTTVPTSLQLWTKNITAPTYGAQSVYEGDLELDVPVLRDLPLAKLVSVSAAGRFTHYSTSGSVQTWRVGVEWNVAPGLNVRATRSRDIRAPTLYDLYQGKAATISGYTDYLTGTSGQILNISQGNPNLKPEIAQNTTVGATYQPSWFRNLTLSADYFDVKINNAISSVSGLTASVEKLCIASGGSSPLCALAVRPNPITDTSAANAPTANIKENENIAKVEARGVVIGLDYAINLAEATRAIPGNANIHVQWTHEPVLKSQQLPGAIYTNAAGTALAPVDRIATTFEYGVSGIDAAVTLRYFSGFHYSADPTLILAQPASKAYVQTDFNLAYTFNVRNNPLSVFLNVNNAFNVHGGLYEASSSNPGLIYPAAPFADEIGRYFTFGVRVGV